MSELGGKKIFIVDDEPDIREILVEALEVLGAKPMTFANGREALQAFHEHKPSIILSDAAMPVLDGMGLFREVRRIDNDCALVLLSAYADRLEQRALNAGADAVFLKPFRLDRLNQFLERLIETGSARKRRLHARIFCRLHFFADLDPQEPPIPTYTFNLSLGGFFIELDELSLPPMGAKLKFEVPVQESWNKTIQGIGECRWLRNQKDVTGPRGFGMEFENPTPELIEAIEGIILKYRPENDS